MTFSFAVRDSLINVGPVKDFAYGLRINADSSAPGIAKQSNYELVSRKVDSISYGPHLTCCPFQFTIHGVEENKR